MPLYNYTSQGNTKPNQTKPNQIKAKQSKAKQSKAKQTKPNQTKPNQTKPNQTVASPKRMMQLKPHSVNNQLTRLSTKIFKHGSCVTVASEMV